MAAASSIIPKNVLARRKRTQRQAIPSNIFMGNNLQEPEHIIIKYTNHVDVSKVDEAIKFKLKNNKRLSDEYVRDTESLIKEYIKTDYIEIAKLYVEKCKKYMKIDIIKLDVYGFNCKGCGLDLKDIKEDMDGIYECPDCKCVNRCIKPIKYIKDLEHHNSNSYDDDINNFMKILDKFEGKNVSSVPDKLFDELDEYFLTKEKMKKGEYYRKLPLTYEGKKEGTSRKKLWLALESKGYNHYYDETSYIAHIYWGWDLPDLSLYRDQILKDYQLTQQVWQRIKKNYKRSASLGTQYRLYVQLKAVGFPNCKQEDFKIQDMVESLRLHNSAWQQMCEETGVKYYQVN